MDELKSAITMASMASRLLLLLRFEICWVSIPPKAANAVLLRGALAGRRSCNAILPAAYEAQMKILVERERVDLSCPSGQCMEADRNLTPDEISSKWSCSKSRTL